MPCCASSSPKTMAVTQASVFLRTSLGHLVVVEIAQGPDHRRAPGHAARLRALLLVDMGDLGRGHRATVEPTGQAECRGARMRAEEPVGPAPTERIELDPLHRLSSPERPVARGVEEIGLEQLQLDRRHDAVAGSPRAAADQHLARLDHLAAGERLEPVEVELAVCVAAPRPDLEEPVDLAVERGVAARRARHDPGADDVVHEHRDRLGRMRVVAHQVPHAVAQQRAGPADLGICRRSRRMPAIGAPAAGRALVGARESLESLPRQNAPRGVRRGDRGDGPIHPGERISDPRARSRRSPRWDVPSFRRSGARWSGCARAGPRPSRNPRFAIIAHPRRPARIGAPERRQFSLCQ